MKLFHFPFKALGSACEVQLYGADFSYAEHIAKRVIADVNRIEQRYSRYRQDSVVSEINRAAKQGVAIDVDEETLSLLRYADTCYQQSDGLFDITSGVLREAWDFKTQRIPEQTQIQALLKRIGWEKVSLHQSTLSFAVPGMQLDFGGIGKEYAVDRAAALCQQHGIKHGLVDLGGDIKIIGPHADGRAWSVGIRHPRKPGELMASISVHQGGIASSGDYERCIMLNGKRYSHILNPKTGWPVKGLASITVMAEQCVIAGSVSTITMLKEKQGKRWLKDLGLKYIWMDDKGRVGGTLAVQH
jgi:FAD:protein FMN transferase